MADRHDLARELLERARDDERAATALLSADEVSDAIIGFHAQQAVEKALKAALAAVGAQFPFTHNLAVLTQLCEDANLLLPDPLLKADLLTPYATQLRYGAAPAGTVGREQAVNIAHGATGWAAGILGIDSHS